MYIPASFRVSDQATILSFIERYDFATIVTSSASDGIVATHVPVLVKRDGDRVVLQGHVARANGHWRDFDGRTQALAIFQGPHGYVSPTWYATAPAVPTWNYAAVHVYGRPLATEDRHVASGILEALVQKYESDRVRPYRTEELAAKFYDQMVSRIVAFEMPVEKIESKFKLGQNRSKADREGTIEGLIAEGSPGAAALAAFMQEHAGLDQGVDE
jgi:transcriptional regulator